MMIDSRNDPSIYLFGAPRIMRGDQTVHLSRRRMYGLLSFLALSKRQFHRERLADLFWPDSDTSHSLSSLRVVLSEIHKVIDPDILPVTNEIVGPLDLSRVSVDIETFQAIMARIRLNLHREFEPTENLLKEAVSLYSGVFMHGFTLKNCRQFSDWQFQQAEYFRRELCYALEHLVVSCEQTGDWEEGISYGRRFVEEDYLNEDAHCSLMRLYAASGQREMAINQFLLYRKALLDELELGPEESTVELYESILHSRPVKKQTTMGTRPAPPRLAVLPFRSLTDKQEWFSDGMTDALITELSGKAGLEVISYNSSRRFAETEKSMRQVASELNVHHLIEGTVLKAGDDIRISAKLIEAAGDRLVWGESYRGSFTGILELQEKIARTITSQVTGKLVSEDGTAMFSGIQPEAREACLMGDYHLRKSESDEEIEKVRDYYQKAADMDSSCADAFAGLAFTYFSILWGGRELLPTEDSKVKVRQFIQRALEIDPKNVRARMVLAGSLWEWDFDFTGAEREFEEILRINPHHIESLCWCAELKEHLGKIDEMSTLVERACSISPLDLVTLDHQYRYCLRTLQYRRCFEILHRIDELSPGQSFTFFLHSILYTRLGQYENAIKHIRKALEILPQLDAYRGVLAFICGKSGRQEEALQIIEMMVRDRKDRMWIRALEISLAYCGLGMDEEALQWLEQSWQEDKLYTMCISLAQPFFGKLNWDPRFQEIVGRAGLPHQLEYVRNALEIQGDSYTPPDSNCP